MTTETTQGTTKKEFMDKLLRSQDHMADMERLEMRVVDILHPFAHVARVVGKINPTSPKLWTRPNIALRLEVGEKGQDERPLTRVYTVRHFDAATNLVEIDFVIHEGDAPAMHWLDRAGKGTSAFMIGPRQHFVPDYHLGHKIAFFADDTAIPALYAILSQWPEGGSEGDARGAQAVVYIDCGAADYAAELPIREGISYHLHVRGQGDIAGKSGYLPAMAKEIGRKTTKGGQAKGGQASGGQDWQIWVACEREEAREIRTHFIDQCGVEKDRMKAIGYWKYGMSSSQLDSARLAHYARLHAAGKGLQQFEEFDVPL